MAEKKIVSAKSTPSDKNTTSKSKGLNIDLSELKKIGAAILAFVVSNPELISKLLEKPAASLKKIVKGEEVSNDTKKKVNKTIDANKAGGLTSILSSLSGLSGGNTEINNLFGNISDTVKGAKSSGIDLGSVASSLLGSGKTSKKTSKNSSNNVLGNIIKGLFK